MPFKERGEATEPRVVDRWDGGVGWQPFPEETMQRTSHALSIDGDVYLVDPVDAEGIDDLVSDLGDVAGVVVLLDRHQRDADAVAQRFDVSVHCPAYVERSFDAPVERTGVRLADTDVRVIHSVSLPGWDEAALFDGETLVVADALGTVEYFTVGRETVGVHPFLRAFPPRTLRDLAPDRILVGHGTGVFEDAESALVHAIDGARTRLPQAWWKSLRTVL
ncbi:MAG: hypothetical protein ABEJ76_09775 [Halanaeroarchaeum sp.]